MRERKKIKQNEKTNKQQQVDSSIHDTYTYCPYVYQVLTFFPEKKMWRTWLMFENWRERKMKN